MRFSTFGFALATFVAAPAWAHFQLQQPACWMSQDTSGSPQKLGPCGNEGGGTPTGIVTAFQTGQTITVTINEIIFHPGHYRIAMSVNDRSELPAEPQVTAGATACGTVPIQNPPVFPVLADNVFPHTAPFNGPQSMQITLPSNVTCSHCTLQVIEFMSDHALNVPGGCFYHHCADFSLQTTPVVDAGASGGAGGSSAGSSGCSFARTSGVGYGAIAPLALASAWLLLRRRRRFRARTPTPGRRG
jgi:hypothetical protein